MALSQDAASMSGQEIFRKILHDAVANTIWFGIAAVVVALIGRFVWWWAGVVLFGVFALVGIISILQSILGTLLGLFTFSATLFEKLRGRYADISEQLYLGAADIVHLAENLIFAGYVFALYRIFF